MKDSSKNKEWERRRRDRLNDAFKKLAQILPNYDPAAKTPKIDILEKAAQFIKELRLSNSRLISQQTQSDEKSKLINELQDESNKLILRVKQLTALLKQAKIRIPLGPSLKIGKKQGKWSNQLTPENVENSTMPAEERSKIDGKKDNPTNVSPDKDGLTINMSSAVCVPANSQAVSISSTNGTPLKETNTDKDCATATVPKTSQAQIPSISPIIKPIVQSVPLPTTTTIILTSCPIPNPLANQPVVTRMTIAPRILPKPDETSHLQKIAILPIRKPLPPKEKKRRNRAKKVKVVPEEPSKSSKATNTIPVVPTEKNVVTTTTSSDVSTQISSEKVTKDKSKDIAKSKEKSETSKSHQKEPPEIIDLTDEKSRESTSITESHKNRQKSNNAKRVIPCPLSKKKLSSPKNVSENKNKDSRKNVSEKAKGIIEQEKQTVTVEKSSEAIPEVSGEDAEKILQNDNIVLESASSKENSNSSKIQTAEREKIEFNKIHSKKSADVTHMVVSSAVTNNSLEINQLEDLGGAEETVEPQTTTVAVEVPSESLREEEATAMEVTENEETVDNGNENDKISECIARSIDLIDPPVGELMELSGDWGEAHSPKSPISPTQMFLSMFPLLPRESIVNASENQSSTCKTSMQFSSVRSSFFIDAMLPEENSNNTETVPANSNHNTVSRNSIMNVPSNSNSNLNTNVSSNSSSNFITSTYNSLVGTTCLAVAPTPTPPRQETTHFHNLDSLNFMSSATSSTFQTPTVSPPKKSSNVNPGINNLSDFRSNSNANPPVSISNSTPAPTSKQIQPNVQPVPPNQNFSQYPSYMHSQSNQHSRQTVPPAPVVSAQNSSNNNANVQQQTQKKHSLSQTSKISLNSSVSSSSSTTSSKTPSIPTSHVQSSSTSSSIPPIARVTQYQPQMSTSDSHNIFRNINITASASATTTHGHSTVPIPVPTPTPHQHHVHHHHPYQNPTFHPNSSSSTRNSRESSKTQNYQNSYTGENSSNLPQSHSNPNTNAKPQKSQIFRPGLTDFNMSARMHTQIHQETPIVQHSQSYSSNDSSNNHQAKSHAPPTSAAVTYSTTNNSNLNPLLNSGNHHNNQSNYPSISTMQPQQSNLQRNSNQTTQNQSNTKTHSHSASNSNASKQQRQYSHSSEIGGNSYSVRPSQQQQNQTETQTQQSHPPAPNHSSNTNAKSQSQSQHPQPHSHSHRSGSQSENQSLNHQQLHHSSRNQSSKGASSTSNAQNNNSGSITSRNSNNPPENSFHLNFSSVIPTPMPISAQPVPPSLVQITNRNRSNNSSSHPAPITNPLQIGPVIAPPPTPIPDFTPSPAMNFNQYHHHDPNIHSSTPNYFPMRHPAPPTPTASRATPFYLQEVHSSESLPMPILPHTPMNNNSANNTNSLQSQNQTNNLNNNSKTNFNPPAPPPVYSHPSHSHHNKNYFLDHSQGHSLYQHSLNNTNVPQPHLQSEAPPSSLVAPPPPIYSHPVHTPHVSHRHPQNCNVGPSQHQSQTQSNISRPQQHQQQNKSHTTNKQTNQNQNQTQSNQNQPHYPVQQSSNNSNTNNANCTSNQQRPNQNTTNNNSIAVPQPNNNSSRPVNWMTDPPHRKPAPVVNNPFSVSKLVGNSSFLANNSYCAEALIRKNPEWSDFHFTPPTPTIAPPPPPQHSHPPHTFVPYQAQNEHPAYSNFTHQYTPNPTPTHFGHFDNTQQHHHHHNHLPHHHAPTSSVSNFNLSSIFPEINDKRTNSNNTSSTNANSNPQDSNTNNRCNYYSGKITK